MLNILGVGYAFPATVITNDFLMELAAGAGGGDGAAASAAINNSGIKSRFSSLPLDYIKETGNRDPRQAYEAAVDTPTDLGLRAAQMALARAGIEPQAIGLIIADTSTPRQTIPAEATRLGKRLGLKVPAFDVLASSASFAAHLELLSAWKDERIPEHVLCVSCNTPTQHVNYRAAGDSFAAAAAFGDGACAMVVSAGKSGRLAVKEAYFASDPAACGELPIPVYGHIGLQRGVQGKVYEPRISQMFEKARQQNNFDPARIFFVGPQFSYSSLEKFAAAAGIDAARHWHNAERCGDTLGAGVGTVLAEHWDEIKSGELLLAVTAGPGVSFGYVLMQGNSKQGEGR